MTDKDIKDYCKNCDVEPPAMKFKCPECEHNPDKEIFAKDINVPRKKQINDSLKNSDKNFNENCTVQKNERVIVMNLSDIIKDKDATISRLQSECNEKSDMIFKLMEQLHQINLRKTQECEKLKEQLMQKDEVNTFFNTPIKGWSDDPCEICPCKNELQLAEQLITGILKTLNLEAYDWRADQNEIITEIKAFKQECEELKAYAQRQENQREEYYKEYIKLSQECEELKNELDLYKTWYRAKHDDVKNYLGRYRKALEKIEEIADVLITETNEYESCYYKSSCGDNCYPRIAKVSEHSLGRQTYCQYEAVAKILDIINKAKGTDNE